MENNLQNYNEDDDDEVTIIKIVLNGVAIDENQVNDEIENVVVDVDENKHHDNNSHNNSGTEEYEQMMLLQSYDIVPNAEDITCPICLDVYGPAEAVILKDCLHSFCWTCLQNTIVHSETPEVRCPFVGDVSACESNLRQREIKALVSPEVFENHLAKSINLAESKAGKSSFHCQTPNCPYWCFVDNNNGDFICTICNKTNCLKCQGVHDGKSCEEYQNEIQTASASNNDAKMSDETIKKMLENGTAMNCTTCNAVLQKISGCDHITCAACKTHLNWRGIGSEYWLQRHRNHDTPNRRTIKAIRMRSLALNRINNNLRNIPNVNSVIEARRMNNLGNGGIERQGNLLDDHTMMPNTFPTFPHSSNQPDNIAILTRLNNTPPIFNQHGIVGEGFPTQGPIRPRDQEARSNAREMSEPY